MTRTEIATQILLILIPRPESKYMTDKCLAQRALALADALLAETRREAEDKKVTPPVGCDADERARKALVADYTELVDCIKRA